MRRVAVAAVVLVGLLGCSDSPEEPEGLLTLDGSPPAFDIERAGKGKCSFDYRAQVSGLDTLTGQERWVTEVPYPGDSRGLVVEDGRVVLRSADYPNDPPSVFALAAEGGAPIWQREIADSFGFVNAPQVTGDVLVTLDGESVVGLRASDGVEQWRYSAGQEPPTVAVDDSNVAVARPDHGEVALFDPATGKAQWTAAPDVEKGGSAGVVLTPDVVVTGGQESDLVGLERSSGAQLWKVPPTTGRYRYGLLGPVGDLVLIRDIASNDPQARPDDTASYLVAVDVHSGEPAWRAPVDGDGIDAATLLGALILAPHGGSVEAIDTATGRVRWTYPLQDVRNVSGPTPELVAIATGDYERATSELAVLDAASGDTRFTVTLPVAATGPVVGVGELLLLGGGIGQDSELVDSDQDGYVFALSASDGEEMWRTERREAVSTAIIQNGDSAIVLSADQGIFCD